MRRILAGLALALLIASPVAAGHQTYSLALDGVSGGLATFSVTRSGNFDNDPVAWVHVECDATSADRAVIWGTYESTTGTATVAAAGSACTAWVTTSPWRVKTHDPSVTFTP
jgi:hypothetical protein